MIGPGETSADILARIQDLRHLPEPPPVTRIEVGSLMHEWLKATARPPWGLPRDNPWRPDGWTPPPPIRALFGVPVVLREDLDPGAWRAIDRDGNVMKEGAL
ncbi:hypothetical protein [Nonomuraea sp. NPDC023979]|uniref:hypothetical protein n=1 Tax=Nonomuraea sp. NPDC023979 TaxID=3154796 RepID=UPI0033F21BC6